MCWALLNTLPSLAQQASASPIITVTTEKDIFDGDIHSPETLNQFPGQDKAISLREAIEAANQIHEPVTILFESPNETMILTVNSPLPPIQNPLVIDGAASHSPQVELRGSRTTTKLSIDGITIASNDSIIRGLIITNFSGNGIVIQGNNNHLENNYIGTDPFGTPGKGNGLNGVVILGESNQIGGASSQTRNVISGNGGHGIILQKGSKNHIKGNLIGEHPTRDTALPNAKDGIMVAGTHNIIGGANPSEANTISGNGKSGIRLLASANHTRIQGNIVGIHSSLQHPLPNKEDGIFIKSRENLIGGGQPGAGNIIGGNGQSGIEIHQGNSNLIQGNFIGTDKEGKANWGNELEGIIIFADKTLVGGKEPYTFNHIAFNKRGGVAIPFGQENTIRGNAIYQNESLAINLLQDHLTPNDPLDKDQGPNGLQNFPVLSIATARSPNDTFVVGELHSQPTQTYQLDFYAGRPEGPLRYQEAFMYLGSHTITTDTKGEIRFSFHLPTGAPSGRYLTATATNKEGNTSELAHSILVNRPNPQITWEEATPSANRTALFQTSYSEGMAPIGILPSTTRIIDVDSPQLTQLTVTINNPLDGETEVLSANQLSPTLSQSYVHGKLTITGNAQLAMYEEALHSLTYQNRSTAPTAAPRLLTVVVSDGDYTSQPFTTKIKISGVNTSPMFTWQPTSSARTTTYTTTFTEGNVPISIVPETLTLTDEDSPQLTQLTATLDNRLDGHHEIIQATFTSPTLQQTFKNGTLTISGEAPIETYQRVLQSLTYENRSPSPTVVPRLVRLLTSDGQLTSQRFTTRVTIDEVNTPPMLRWQHTSAIKAPRTYTTSYKEGADPIPLLPDTTSLTDLDNTILQQLTVTLKNPLDGNQETLDVNVTDPSLTKSFRNGVLTISGSAPIETYETLVRSITYHNHSVAPTPTPRIFMIVASDGTSTSSTHTTQINVTSLNTPPSLLVDGPNSEAPLTFTEGDASLELVSTQSHIEDLDSSTFIELKATLSNPLDREHEILSAQLSNAALTQRYNQGTLTITGKASKADYESILQSLTYLNNQAQPQEGSRDILLSIQDSQGSVSQAHMIQIEVKAKPTIPPAFTQPFIASLDTVAEDVETVAQQEQSAKQLVVKTVTGSGLMVTAGIFIWVLRGTSLLASMWATIPAWNSIDPLPILGMTQEERWNELITTQQVEAQEQEEFPQFKEIFSKEQTASLAEKDSSLS